MDDGFVAIDWGSSNFRAYLVNASGDLVDRLATADGAATLSRDGMVDAIDAVASRWPLATRTLLGCGMIGSSVGWEEVPYLTCPVDLDDVASQATAMTIGNHRLWVSPGLTCRSADGFPDVIRGEEVLCIGAVRRENRIQKNGGILCFPGTHTKWVAFSDGVVRSFSTSLVGELYEALSRSDLLKHHLKDKVRVSDAFRQGVDYGASGGGLMRFLFSVRSRSVVGELAYEDGASFASGILIGSDIRDAMGVYSYLPDSSPLVLVGDADLCELYRAALQQLSRNATVIPSEEACIEGFRLIHEVIREMHR